MTPAENKNVFELITRFNQIMKEQEQLELQRIKLDAEYNEIVLKLWDCVPSLKDSVDIQPKRKVKK